MKGSVTFIGWGGLGKTFMCGGCNEYFAEEQVVSRKNTYWCPKCGMKISTVVMDFNPEFITSEFYPPEQTDTTGMTFEDIQERDFKNFNKNVDKNLIKQEVQMKFKPVNQTVILRVMKREEKVGNVIIPDTAITGDKWIGIVESVSPYIKNCLLKPGDMVKHNPHGAQFVESIDANTKLIAVGYDDIYCKVEEE